MKLSSYRDLLRRHSNEPFSDILSHNDNQGDEIKTYSLRYTLGSSGPIDVEVKARSLEEALAQMEGSTRELRRQIIENEISRMQLRLKSPTLIH